MMTFRKLLLLTLFVYFSSLLFSMGIEQQKIVGKEYYLKFHVLSLGNRYTIVYEHNIEYTKQCIDSTNVSVFYDNITALIYCGEKVTITKYEDRKNFVFVTIKHKKSTTCVLLSKAGNLKKEFNHIFSKKYVYYDFESLSKVDFDGTMLKTKEDVIRWLGYPISICHKDNHLLLFYNVTFLGKIIQSYNDFWVVIENGKVLYAMGDI